MGKKYGNPSMREILVWVMTSLLDRPYAAPPPIRKAQQREKQNYRALENYSLIDGIS